MINEDDIEKNRNKMRNSKIKFIICTVCHKIMKDAKNQMKAHLLKKHNGIIVAFRIEDTKENAHKWLEDQKPIDAKCLEGQSTEKSRRSKDICKIAQYMELNKKYDIHVY